MDRVQKPGNFEQYTRPSEPCDRGEVLEPRGSLCEWGRDQPTDVGALCSHLSPRSFRRDPISEIQFISIRRSVLSGRIFNSKQTNKLRAFSPQANYTD
jgi:hypothetical protein